MSDDVCLICGGPVRDIQFCDTHTNGWLKSDERKTVDFSSEESYYSGTNNYAKRFKLDGEQEGNLPEDDMSNLHG